MAAERASYGDGFTRPPWSAPHHEAFDALSDHVQRQGERGVRYTEALLRASLSGMSSASSSLAGHVRSASEQATAAAAAARSMSWRGSPTTATATQGCNTNSNAELIATDEAPLSMPDDQEAG